MSLQFVASGYIRSCRPSWTSGAYAQVQKRTIKSTKTLSSRFCTRSSHRGFKTSSYYSVKSGRDSRINEHILSGDKEAVRAAYRAKSKTSDFSPSNSKSSSSPSKATSTGDIMEDILNEALPNRKKSTVPDLGDVKGIKTHLSQTQREEGEISLAELRELEAEEDRAYVEGHRGGADESYEGFGVDAPVRVPHEVFELNAQAQFSFLKEEYSDALDYLEQSMEIIRSRLGANHNEAATVMVSMAQVHEKLKNFDDAEQLLTDAIAIRKLVDGPVHTSVATALNKLSHVQTCQKNFDAAIKSNKQAFRIIEAARLQNEHELSYYTGHQMEIPEDLLTVRRALQTEAGQIMNTRGAIRFKNKETAEAIADWNKAVEIWSQLLIETDSVASPLFAVHRNLGHLYKQKNDVGAAETVAKNFVALLERHQPQSPLLPSAYLYLSQIHEHFSLLSDALKAAESALQACIAINGRGEESDDIEEAVALIRSRVSRKLGVGEEEED